MARIGDLNIRIGATIDGLRRGLQQAERSLQRSSRRMSDLGTRLTFTATASIGALGVSAVRTAAEFETLQNSLNILTGSAEEGAKAFERLKEFSAKTPFQLQDLMRANNTLMGFGLTADDAFNSFKQLGDISAVVGGDLQRIAVAYGQSIAANRVDARDILQFINNGVPIMEILAEAMGVAVSEVKQLASEGKVTGDVLRKAFTTATAEGGKFYKGLETASQTLSGKFSTLKDNISLALGEIGQSIAEAINLREVIDTLIKAVASLADGFKNLPDGVKKAIVIFAGFVAAVGPVLVAVASFKALLAGLAGSLAFALGAVLPITAGLVALGAAFYKAHKNSKFALETTKDFAKELSKASSKGAAPLLVSLDKLEKKLIGLKREGKEFGEVQKELKTAYADHIEDADNLGTSYGDLKKAIDSARTSVLELAKSQAAVSLTQAVDAELNEIKAREIDLEFKFGESPQTIVQMAEEMGKLGYNASQINKKLNAQGIKISFKQQQDLIAEVNKLHTKQNNLLEKRNYLLSFVPDTPTGIEEEVTPASVGGQEVEETEFSKILSKYKEDSRALNNLRIDRLIDEEQYNKDYLALQRNFLVQLSQAGLSSTDLYKQIFEKYASMRKAALAEIKAIDSANFEIIPLSVLQESGKRAGEAYAKAIKDGVARIDAVGEAFGAIGSFDQLDSFTNLFNGMQGLLEDTAKFGELSFYNMWKAFSSDANKAVQTTAQALAGITQGISSIISTAVSRDLESLDVSLQKQMKAIDKLNISEEAKQKHRLRAEERYNKQVAQLKAKQFRADKAAAIAQAAMNTAVGITQLIASGVGTALIPVVAALGSAQIAAIASQPVPQFANGGIVNGRTLAEVGEYGSAARGNPEVIAPLNKLKSMLGDMGGGNITGEFRLRGDDLVAAVEQANRKTARFSGTTQF